jgi:GR25 family glycosyltransferase involved in LPS biosynthesis
MILLTSSSEHILATSARMATLLEETEETLIVYLVDTPVPSCHFPYSNNRVSMRHISSHKSPVELIEDAIANGLTSGIYLDNQYPLTTKVLSLLRSEYKFPVNLDGKVIGFNTRLKKVPVYIVHYTKLTQRKATMMNWFTENYFEDLFKVRWIESFDRETLTDKDVRENYAYNPAICNRCITLGEVANGMCHSYIINECATGNEDVSMVIEDDMIFTENFITNIFKCLTEAPADWDIIGVGGATDTNDYTGQPVKLISSPTGFTPTGCFLIRKGIAGRIVSHILFKPFSAPIDHNLNHIFLDLKPVVYWISPFIAYEGSKSNLYKSSFTDRGF